MDQEYFQELREVEGTRPALFDKLDIPKGWVVTTKVSPDFWGKCKTRAIPMRAKKFLGLFHTDATRQMIRWESKYGKNLAVVLIPDDEAFRGYSWGFILLINLYKNPIDLLEESDQLYISDKPLSDAKRRSAMVLTGWTDTK